jgi:hypothetical protein
VEDIVPVANLELMIGRTRRHLPRMTEETTMGARMLRVDSPETMSLRGRPDPHQDLWKERPTRPGFLPDVFRNWGRNWPSIRSLRWEKARTCLFGGSTMFKAWDSDKKLLVILVVAGVISLAITHKNMLAQMANGVVQNVEETLGRFRSRSPNEDEHPSRSWPEQGRFSPGHWRLCEPACDRIGSPMLFRVVGRHGCDCVVYPCRGIRTCRP